MSFNRSFRLHTSKVYFSYSVGCSANKKPSTYAVFLVPPFHSPLILNFNSFSFAPKHKRAKAQIPFKIEYHHSRIHISLPLGIAIFRKADLKALRFNALRYFLVYSHLCTQGDFRCRHPFPLANIQNFSLHPNKTHEK